MEDTTDIFDAEAERYDAWFDTPEGHSLFENELVTIRLLSPRVEAPDGRAPTRRTTEPTSGFKLDGERERSSWMDASRSR